MAMLSLYDRLGGEAAVQAAVVLFYDRVMVDPVLAPFFAGYDLADQVLRHIAFMNRAFGREPVDAGDLTTPHRGLVQRGLGDAHVDRFIEVTEDVLRTLGVAQDDIDEVKTRLAATRAHVLGRP